MSERAVAGHGATIAWERDPVGAQGTFTVIPEQNGDIAWPEFSVPETDVTAHNDTIDYFIVGVAKRSPMTFTVSYVHDDTDHEDLLNAPLSKLKRGFRLRGPNGSANDDEVIASGYVTNFGPITHPVREGARTAQVTVRFSGPMQVNGVAYGT